ncbi:MAG: glutamyl-tRNA reductase [Planctomycetota bacterium]|jgi:glutamyl-tRNA reductase
MAVDLSNSLFIIGMNHRVAEVAVRGRFSLSETQREQARAKLSDQDLEGNVLLSTCNRTELYASHASENDRAGDYKSLIFPGLEPEFEPYWHTGWNTVFHLFRVSAGLDSMIVGESEILRQIKVAHEESLSAGSSGRVLTDLFRQSLEVGKRIRTETQISLGSVSVAATAVKLAGRIFSSLKDKRVVIIGAGETGIQTARHLKSLGVTNLVLANRTIEKAEALAKDLGASACGLDDLGKQMHKADLIISAVEAPECVVTTDLLDGAPRNTRCFIDISVPRSMDPKISEMPGVFHFDIDDLSNLIESVKSERDQEAKKSTSIVVGEVHKFLAKQHFLELAPLVEEMRLAFDETLGATLKDAAAEEFSAEAAKLAKRLLGVSLNTLKLSSRTHVSVEQVQGAYELFMKENV